MDEKILDLAKQLISLPTTSDNKSAITNALKLIEEYLVGFTMTSFEKNGVKSLLISNKTDEKKFRVILNAHIDVVPGLKSQFTPLIKNGKLFGRGAYDMKAAAAAMIVDFKQIAKSIFYPLALQIVTDEETGGHNGTLNQLENGINGEFAIMGENTDFALKDKAKGIIWVKIITKGKSSHGAYPWLGENAVKKMNNIIDVLQKQFPNPKTSAWQTTINIASIQSDNAVYNKVPGVCTAQLDIRYIPADEGKIQELLVGISSSDAEVSVAMNEPCMFVDSQIADMQKLEKIIARETNKSVQIIFGNGASDARFYTSRGIPATEFGPIGAGHHSDNEWVDIKSLRSYAKILNEFLLEIN